MVVLDVDQQDAVGGIRILGAVGQQEAQAARRRHFGDALHAVEAAHEGADLPGPRVGRVDRRALRHPHVHHELRPSGIREEVLLHLREAVAGGDQQRQQRRRRQPAVADARDEEGPVALVELARVGVGVLRRRALFLEERGGQQGRQRDRQHPAHQQRNQQHQEQRAAVFAGAVLRGPDRRERQDRHRRGAQQRPLGLLHDGQGGLDLVLPLLRRDQHAFGDDDGIVHQHSQRDDERPQADPLEQDAQILHDEHRAHHRHHQHHPDQHAALHAHGQQQDGHHDDDRLDQVDQKAADRDVHAVGLVRNHAEFDADGRFGAQFLQAPVDGFAHHHHVAALDRGNAQPDAGLAVVAQEIPGRIEIAAPDRRDVLQADRGAARAPRPRLHDQQLAQFLHRLQLARRRQPDELVADLDGPGVGRVVLAGDGVLDLLGRNARGGQARPGNLEIDDFGLVADHLDLGDVLAQQQFAAQDLGVGLQVRVGIAVAVDAVEHAEHVAVVVDDLRRVAAGRQAGLHVAHLAAQFVPDLRQVVLAVLVFHLDHDDGAARIGRARHLLHLPHLLDGDLDGVGHLFHHFLRGRAGIAGDDLGVLDGELGIFEPPDLGIGPRSAQQQRRREDVGENLLLDAELGDAHGAVSAAAAPSSSRRTWRPSVRIATPAAAMRAPGARPSSTSTLSPSRRPSATACRRAA